MHAATHTNNEISLPQDNTVMHAWPDSVAPTGRPAESYTPNNCYRGKLHVPCVPLRNSVVTLLSLARNHYGLCESYVPFFSQRIFATRYRGRSGIVGDSICSIIDDANEIESSRESWKATTRVIVNAICMHYRSRTNANLLCAMCVSRRNTCMKQQ